MNTFKRVSMRDVIAAIRKNGYPQAFETFFALDEQNVSMVSAAMSKEAIKFNSACAIGQAAVNLGVDATKLSDELLDYMFLYSSDEEDERSVNEVIILLNDDEGKSLQDIADELESVLSKDILDKEADILEREYLYVSPSEGNP